MPEELPSKIDHATLEREIQNLAREVREKINALLRKPEEGEMRNIIRESMISGAPSATPADKPSPAVLPDYLSSASPEVKLKIERLVDKVFHAGIGKTLAEAKKEGPFFLDAFHDALSGKLYEEMKRRKII